MKSVVPLTLCDSSNIRAYGYQPDGQILEVQFKTGTSYQYKGVPPEVYEDFKGCPSMGRFFQERIRGKFDTEKVERDAPPEAAEGEAA